ncbi:spore germination protein KA [Paenibacillus sp. 1_12]|uniref:spore germination protein n=1 Tax=Paenibacillus sp. 1_12 TaxID=1566278 RepID=UPI0008E6CA0D|nr:spore germination protein [Paenibacillus sp. 1_12]SFL22314.1 spore germination protein KA [Paenibacillus sp. 1_12]
MDNNMNLEILKILRSSNHASLLSMLQEAFQHAADFEVTYIGEVDSQKVYLCYLSTLVGSNHFGFQMASMEERQLHTVLERYYGTPYSEGNFQTCESSICSGKTVLCMANSSNGIILETFNPQQSSVQPPQTENVIQGPMYAFNENYQTNIALLRQRMKTSRLKIWESTVGNIMHTKVGVVYLQDVTEPSLVHTICDQLKKVDVDGIQDTGELLRLLNNQSTFNLYPIALTSERPDRAAASLLDGKVIIILDGTPFSIIAPTAFVDFWHSAEDQYLSPFIAVFLRVLRFAALMINLFLPGFYVAITSVNIDVNRLEISLAAAASREGVPYPVLIEAMLMLLILDFIVEAGVRLPKSISSTVTMVGGVVLGQAIIQANIVSNLLVIVAATTAITNFIVIDYQMGLVQRLLKYFVLIGASLIGVLGIVVCFVIMVIFLSRIESFGVSYLTPIGPMARVRSRGIGLHTNKHPFSIRFLMNSWKEKRQRT